MENSATDKSKDSDGFYTYHVNSPELAKKKLRPLFLRIFNFNPYARK
jgi:hypothetical protein